MLCIVTWFSFAWFVLVLTVKVKNVRSEVVETLKWWRLQHIDTAPPCKQYGGAWSSVDSILKCTNIDHYKSKNEQAYECHYRDRSDRTLWPIYLDGLVQQRNLIDGFPTASSVLLYSICCNSSMIILSVLSKVYQFIVYKVTNMEWRCSSQYFNFYQPVTVSLILDDSENYSFSTQKKVKVIPLFTFQFSLFRFFGLFSFFKLGSRIPDLVAAASVCTSTSVPWSHDQLYVPL